MEIEYYVGCSFLNPILMIVSNFTEHMLFYASEKYPEEDSYSKYIAEVCLILPGWKLSLSYLYYLQIDPCKWP